MLKNILNLKGATALNNAEQKEIFGGITDRPVLACEQGCSGKSNGDSCYASPNCGCPGRCGSFGCIPF